MRLRVDRYAADTEATLGRLYIDDAFECFTLEDQGREGAKVKGETRIPAGEYAIKLRPEGGWHEREAKRYDKKFGAGWHKGMLHLQNVPGFEYILIHAGNTEQETMGCLLVGAATGVDRRGHHSVLSSRSAYEKLYPKISKALLAGESVTIKINDQPTVHVPVEPAPTEKPGAAAVGTVIAGAGAAGAGALILSDNDEPAPQQEQGAAAPAPAEPSPAPSTDTTTATTAPPSEVWPPSQSTLGWAVAAIGAVVVLLGLYLLFVRFRAWRHRRAG